MSQNKRYALFKFNARSHGYQMQFSANFGELWLGAISKFHNKKARTVTSSRKRVDGVTGNCTTDRNEKSLPDIRQPWFENNSLVGYCIQSHRLKLMDGIEWIWEDVLQSLVPINGAPICDNWQMVLKVSSLIVHFMPKISVFKIFPQLKFYFHNLTENIWNNAAGYFTRVTHGSTNMGLLKRLTTSYLAAKCFFCNFTFTFFAMPFLYISKFSKRKYSNSQ